MHIKKVKDRDTYLVIDNPKFKHYKEKPWLASFVANPYKKLNNGGDDSPNAGFHVVVGPTNRFFERLSEEDQHTLCLMYTAVKLIIVEMGSSQDREESMKRASQDIQKVILDSFDKARIIPQVERFVKEELPVKLSKDIGKKEQDTKDMTFFQDEVIKITEIAMLSKILVPIFGEYMAVVQNMIDDKENKEVEASYLIVGVLNKYYSPVVQKLLGFMEKTVKRRYNKDNLSALFSKSHTPTTIVNRLFAQTIARKLAIIDLYAARENYMMSQVHRACQHSCSPTQSKKKGGIGSVITRTLRSDISGDDGNTSLLEMGSQRSKTQASVPVLVRLAAEKTIEKNTLLLKESFSGVDNLSGLVEEIADFYNEVSEFDPNPANVFILATMFAKDLGGAKSINYVRAREFSKLLAVAQLTLLLRGSYELMHLLSAKFVEEKEEYNSIDKRIRATYSSGYGYVNCMGKFEFTIGKVGWDTHYKKVVDYLTCNEHITNTAPAIWNILEQENQNGEVFAYSSNICEEICNTIDTYTEQE